MKNLDGASRLRPIGDRQISVKTLKETDQNRSASEGCAISIGGKAQ